MTSSFLQSPEWQEVQRRMGRGVARIGPVLVIRHDLPFGLHYLYAPRPAAVDHDFFLGLARSELCAGPLFLKIDPLSSLPHASFPQFLVRPLQPSATMVVACTGGDRILFGAMHPKTRYNIRLAERHGVSVRTSERPVSAADLDTFMRLLASTAEREGFSAHPPAHYRILLAVASADFTNELFIAEYRGRPVAAAIVNCYTPTGCATYLHGGSSRAEKGIMAPHLLHWRVIQYLRERKLPAYDLGGIDERRWPGLTRFKQGFGGEHVVFPPSSDYVFRPWLYRLYRMRRAMRAIL